MFLLILLVLIQFVNYSESSNGDRDKSFQVCLSTCYCPPEKPFLIWASLGWSCLDTCKYNCMWSVEGIRKVRGLPPMQYYGKWPFKAILGVQEPASCLFSLLNLLVHFYYLQETTSKEVISYWTKSPWYINLIKGKALVGCLAWIGSTLFHARDKPWTEKLDYYGAVFLLIYTVWYSLVIVLNINKRRTMLGLSLGAFYLNHLRMMWPRIDYGYNMKVCVVLSLTYALLWSVHSMRTKRLKPLLIVIALIGSGAVLELNDFPPLFDSTLDAHALWHAMTVPLSAAWYHYLLYEL